MRRLDRPSFFDDHAAFEALASNAGLASYPLLQEHVAAILEGYDAYVAAAGNARVIAPVPLPENIASYLKNHYADPPAQLAHIAELRDEGAVRTCPMCGSTRSISLDHLLPKIDHPAFAVFGANMVPACDCNMRRGTTVVGPDEGQRILHPYFDDVLDERILAARFDDLGPTPRVSIRMLLDPDHPDLLAVDFHVTRIVARTQLERHVRRLWNMLVEGPARLTTRFLQDPTSREDLLSILTQERDRIDDYQESRNSWDSIFWTALLDDHVVDWLHARFSAPGRAAAAPLLP